MAKTTTSKTRKRRIPRKRKPQTTGLAPLDCRTELTDDLRVPPNGGLGLVEGLSTRQREIHHEAAIDNSLDPLIGRDCEVERVSELGLVGCVQPAEARSR